ncbi:MAG: S9 family peptidase, partial [Asticcacaulis sp.]|nr:S9 family peptidase [Asticcacaulis sp.]
MLHKLLFSAAFIALATAAPVHAQDKDTGTEVVVKGVPRLRPAAADPLPPLDIFVKPARIEQIALSPDGSELAFTTHVEGEHLLAIYQIADGSKRAVKLADDPLTALTFVDNDHLLLSSSQTGLRGTCPAGDNQTKKDNDTKMSIVQSGGSTGSGGALSLLNYLHTPGCAWYGVRSEEAVTVVNLKADKGVSIGNHMSEFNNLALGIPKTINIDGKPMLMGAFKEMRRGDLDREARYVDDWLFDDHGQLLARTVYNFLNETFSIEMRDSKTWKPVTRQKIEARILALAPSLVGMGRDGKSVVIFDRDPATGRFHYYDLTADGTRSAPLEPDDALHDRPVFHPATGQLSGFVREDLTPDYQLSDPALARIYEAGQDSAAGQSVRIAATARDPRLMIIHSQGGNDAGNYYFVDMVKGTYVDLGNDHAAIPAEWVANQSAIDYPSGDGLTIHALLTTPTKPEAKNLPLVVLPHDGPQGFDAVGYNWLAQSLASRGYLVLQPNYRGSDGAGADFRAAGAGQWGSGIPADLDAGVHDLVSRGLADPNRVCIVGVGYGGYLALNGAVSGKYRCAAAVNGISDAAAYATWMRVNRPILDADQLGGLEADPAWPGA